MLNILYSYFGQEDMVRKQMTEWNKYRTKARLTYVDDCSPKPLKVKGANVYRILTDIKWNQGGARNLGMSKLKGWVLMLDMDYIATKENIEDILKLKLDKNTIYYLGREGHPLSYTIYLIHTDTFKKIWYDESFSGNYGYDDTDFNWRASKILKTINLDNIKIGFDHAGGIDEPRDSQRNADLFNWKRMFEEKPKKLNFKYKKVC